MAANWGIEKAYDAIYKWASVADLNGEGECAQMAYRAADLIRQAIDEYNKGLDLDAEGGL